MASPKEHFLVHQDDDRCEHAEYRRFEALGGLGHRHLFLKNIKDEVDDHAWDDASVAFQIDPGEEKARREDADIGIDRIPHIHFQDHAVIRVGNTSKIKVGEPAMEKENPATKENCSFDSPNRSEII